MEMRKQTKGSNVYLIYAFPSALSSLDISEDANAAHYANLGDEEIIREDVLLEATKLQQLPEDGRCLDVDETAHDLAGNATAHHAALDHMPPHSFRSV